MVTRSGATSVAVKSGVNLDSALIGSFSCLFPQSVPCNLLSRTFLLHVLSRLKLLPRLRSLFQTLLLPPPLLLHELRWLVAFRLLQHPPQRAPARRAQQDSLLPRLNHKA